MGDDNLQLSIAVWVLDAQSLSSGNIEEIDICIGCHQYGPRSSMTISDIDLPPANT